MDKFIEALELIEKFNKDNNLIQLGYEPERESSFVIEEALEGFANYKGLEPKEASRAIIKEVEGTFNGNDIDAFDKHLDIIVFSIGSLLKLGLELEEIGEGLLVVANKNLEKCSVGKDKYGKQMKPEDFVGPEAELEKIYNKGL